MKRRLLNALTLLSTLLCVTAAALWVRSYQWFDDVAYSGRFHVDNFCSYRGRFFVQLGWSTTDHLVRSAPPYSRGGWFWDSTEMERVVGYLGAQQSRGWQLGGFDVSRRISKRLDPSGRPDGGEDVVVVPYWFLCLLTAAAPLQWLRRRRRLRLRHGASVCPHCGYDLRASPGRCPECGREASVLSVR